MIESALADACDVGSDPATALSSKAHLLMGDADKETFCLKPEAYTLTSGTRSRAAPKQGRFDLLGQVFQPAGP